MDQRGFGRSEGSRGYLESVDASCDDFLEYSRRVQLQYGGDDVPFFTISHSLGGCLMLSAAAREPEMFNGMTLLTPFLGLTDKA